MFALLHAMPTHRAKDSYLPLCSLIEFNRDTCKFVSKLIAAGMEPVKRLVSMKRFRISFQQETPIPGMEPENLFWFKLRFTMEVHETEEAGPIGPEKTFSNNKSFLILLIAHVLSGRLPERLLP